MWHAESKENNNRGERWKINSNSKMENDTKIKVPIKNCRFSRKINLLELDEKIKLKQRAAWLL